MGCTLEVALLLVKTRKSDENVQFDTCYKRIDPCGCSHDECVARYQWV